MPRKSDNRVHQSDLKAIESSPAHYKWQIDHQRPDSAAMRMGRALHSIYLQGIHPICFEGGKRGTKAWDGFVEMLTNPDDVLIPAERDTVLRMHEALERDPDAKALMSRCIEREVALEWDLMGLPCAGRLDARGPGVLMDLKSCRAAYPKKFLWEAANKLHYDAQLAWYDVAGGVIPCGPDTAWSEQYLVAVENVAPYNVQVYKLDNLRIDQGWEKIQRWMQILNACLKSGRWPGYLEGVQAWDGELSFAEPDDEPDDEE